MAETLSRYNKSSMFLRPWPCADLSEARTTCWTRRQHASSSQACTPFEGHNMMLPALTIGSTIERLYRVPVNVAVVQRRSDEAACTINVKYSYIVFCFGHRVYYTTVLYSDYCSLYALYGSDYTLRAAAWRLRDPTGPGVADSQ